MIQASSLEGIVNFPVRFEVIITSGGPSPALYRSQESKLAFGQQLQQESLERFICPVELIMSKTGAPVTE